MRPVTAIIRGPLLIIKGVRPLLRQIEERDRQSHSNWATDGNSDQNDRPQNNAPSRRITIGSLTDAPSPYNDDDDGPNHKGTYSKAYTLKHPEVKWVHRGQGRYLPSNTVSYPPQPASTPLPKSNHTPRFSGRSSLRRRSGDNEVDADNDENDDNDASVDSQPAVPSKRLSDASYSLRRRQSEAGPLTPGELRAARLHRRSGPLDDFRDDEVDEEEVAEDESESGDDSERTYTKEYKEAHPEHTWRHCGNGFYKKTAKPSLAPSIQSSRRDSNRRDSNRSQFKAEPDVHEVRRYRLSDFANFPGEKPIHCGNGWYRRESSLQEAADQTAIESSDDDDDTTNGERNEKFSKEEMVNFLNSYPDATFEHRGSGRYVLVEQFSKVLQTPIAKPPVPVPVGSPGQTFSKSYVERHPNESFFHAGSGRYRRGSRPTRPSDASRKNEQPVIVEKPAVPTGLVNKEFVLAHPHMEFHHRGQGRYAYGPRPVETPVAPVPVKEPTPSPAVSDTELVDTTYVEAHPYETFHHRGQGRWARGLPPPGSSNKTAVRGPMAAQAKFSLTPSNPPVEDLPGLEELLIRAEGPDKYPHLEWVYRGGGKWARTAKQKEQDAVNVKTTNTRGSRGKSLAKVQDVQEDSDGSEEVMYTDDEFGATAGGSFQETLYESRGASVTNAPRVDSAISRRQRLYLQPETVDAASVQTSKNPSLKSKTTTPKPQRLTLEEDNISDEANYPSLHASVWPPPRTDEPFDAASKLARIIYKPLNPPDVFVNALTRRDPAVRPKEVLRSTTAHMAALLQQLQDEYLELDKITAPHARVPRKPVKGGRMPLDDAVYEDKKEADLYDYTYDPRKVGYQNPDAQKIFRDAEGRALRKRRQRNGLDVESAATPGGEEVPLGPRRATKPVSRFDGIAPAPATRKKRTANGTLKPGSMTPDPNLGASAPPPQVLSNGYVVRTSGRWKNHIPKRIRELRGDSVGASPVNGVGPVAATGAGASPGPGPGVGAAPGAVSPSVEEGAMRSETPGTSSDTPLTADGKEDSPGAARKGRPKGSKNLHKRRDAGIPKGPRKPKVVASIESSVAQPTMNYAQGAYPGSMSSRDARNDPWSRIGSSRIGYPFD
jgi:hypothetical protein